MIPAAFDYRRADGLDEVLAALATDAPVTLLAGGQSLLPLLKLRLAEVGTLLDIGRIPELRGVRLRDEGGIAIGAATTWNEILEDPRIATHAPLLGEVVAGIGDVQVRNRGTMGGSVAHADPAADIVPALLALDATIALRSATSRRAGPADGFFRGPFETVRRADELIVEIRIPALPAGAGSAWRAVSQPASGWSIAAAAAVLAIADGRISHARVALGGAGECGVRAKAVEAALVGRPATAETIASAASAATEGIAVQGDLHADAAYRTSVARVVVRRALEAALDRAAG